MFEVYDIETYKHAFIYCSLDIKTGKKYVFEISRRKNDAAKMAAHLKKVKYQIGFNNLHFDYPIVDFVIKNHNKYLTGEALCYDISLEANKRFSHDAPRLRKFAIKQIDLFKIWHFDNQNNSASLKWLEFAMRMDDIEDLPYPVDATLTDDMIDNLIEYCHHDVKATKMFYDRTIKKLTLRKNLSKVYGIDLLNHSDVGMAETLVLNSYCELTGKKKWDVSQLRSEYKFILARDVIMPEIHFQTPELQRWLSDLKNVYLLTPGGRWKGCSVPLGDEVFDIALGGIHIKQKALAFYAEEDEYLAELDCSGMYATFIDKWGQYPAQLGKEFLFLYRKIREDRMAAKKSGDKIMDAAGKLMGNGTFGKFGSDKSYLYDLKMLFTVTLNNQLLLLMLAERCHLQNLKVISANTDSITVKIKKVDIPKLEKVVEEWEKISRHTMEYTPYECIIYRDVNNYLSKTTDGKVKPKGCFEIIPMKNGDIGYSKNWNMRIVPMALEKYYLEGVKVEDTVLSHTNIFDFLKAAKGTKTSKFVYRELTTTGIDDTALWGRVNRYYVSNKGGKIIKLMPPLMEEENYKADKLAQYKKKNPQQLNLFDFVEDVIQEKDRESEVEAGFKTQVANRLDSKRIEDFDINYEYYIEECYKIIREIQ